MASNFFPRVVPIGSSGFSLLSEVVVKDWFA